MKIATIPATTTASALPTPLLSEHDAAKLCGMSVYFLRSKRVTGGGPAFHRFGRSVRYKLSDLMEWLDQHAARQR
jgi:hypothetical protein